MCSHVFIDVVKDWMCLPRLRLQPEHVLKFWSHYSVAPDRNISILLCQLEQEIVRVANFAADAQSRCSSLNHMPMWTVSQKKQDPGLWSHSKWLFGVHNWKPALDNNKEQQSILKNKQALIAGNMFVFILLSLTEAYGISFWNLPNGFQDLIIGTSFYMERTCLYRSVCLQPNKHTGRFMNEVIH